MKKVDNSRIEYAVMNQPNNIENRSEAMVNDNELEFIKAHWQKNIIKHQPPIINNVEDLKRLKIDGIT